MNTKEKKLLQICIKHLEESLKVLPQVKREQQFNQGRVYIPEVTYFALLGALDRVNNVKDIIKERVI